MVEVQITTPILDAQGRLATPSVLSQIDARADARVKVRVPDSGTAGQVLQRTATGTAWAPAPTSLPPGGTSGQTIVKQSDGSTAWANPTGTPGRGITSIVASTSDPTKATVTYTDGTTAPLTLPQGAAGRSISSFGAPDPTTGVSVVTFSDGSTTTITLPKGPQGDTGPAPTVSWTGDVLTVGGKASPPLTGPASTTPGPAPSIKIGTVTSGTTPSATITGTSPDLTLNLALQPGAKGDPGAPGVVSSASSYVIVGPGRPDTPSTTGGVITGSEPVGAEYRSTDGASVGAYVWMKRPGGKWEASSADTGWRSLQAADGVSAAHLTTNKGGTGTTGSLGVRRADTTVYVLGYWNSAGGTPGGRLWELPPGWRLPMAVPGGGYGTQEVARWSGSNTAAWTVTNGVGLNITTLPGGENRVYGSWVTTESWPTTLPGTPA